MAGIVAICRGLQCILASPAVKFYRRRLARFTSRDIAAISWLQREKRVNNFACVTTAISAH